MTTYATLPYTGQPLHPSTMPDTGQPLHASPLGAVVTAPGYYFITGVDKLGHHVAGVVKFTKAGTLPNATNAIFIDAPNVKSLSMARLKAAVESTGSTFLYEVPATGNHTNLQSIGARAVGQGSALYNNTQAGVQAVNDLTIAALIVGAGVAAGVVGGGAAAGAEGAGAGAAGGGVAAGVAKGIAGSVAGDIGLAGLAGVLAVFTNLSFWLRLGEAVLGGVLLILALRSLTGHA